MDKISNVLMIYPLNPQSFWNMEHITNVLRKKSYIPPLGLLTVAAMLPKEWNVRVVDLNVRPISEDDYNFADYMFVTGMIVQEISFLQVAKDFQKRGIPVVAGGPYVTSCYKEITCVDHFILGEAEITIGDFVDDLRNNRVSKKFYQANEYPDMSLSPTPRYDLINVDNYISIPMEVSRGCPHDCEFCCVTAMLGSTPRYKTHGQITRQLDSIYKTGHRGMVTIIDDNFAGNFSKAKDILLDVIDWQERHDFPFAFGTQATINITKDESLVQLLSRAKFETIFFGIETPSEEALLEAGKNQNLNISLTEAVNIIHKHGIAVSSGFIVGFDSDDESIFGRQIEFVSRAAIVRPMFGILNALPGTKLTERLEDEGRMLSRSDGSNETLTNFKTVMGHAVLLSGYLKILETAWNPENYFDRLLRSLELMKEQHFAVNKKRTLRDYIVTIRFLNAVMSSRYSKNFIIFLIKAKKKKIPLKTSIAVHFRGHHYLKYNQITAIPRLKKALLCLQDEKKDGEDAG